MKTFETVSDILENARIFHQFAENLYLKLQQESKDERAKMLLGFMAKHEKEMETKVSLFGTKSPKNILDTWMQFTVEELPETFFEEVSKDITYTVDGISDMGQRADSYLEAVFQEAVDTAPSVAVKELFENLVEQEEVEKHQLSRATNSLWDV